MEMSKGMMFWQLVHCSSVSGPGMEQNTQPTCAHTTGAENRPLMIDSDKVIQASDRVIQARGL